jgi:hypothetical protein
VTNLVPYVTDTEQVRAEPVALPVEVLVPRGGGYTRLSGSEVAMGQAVVRNVPRGPYLVRSGKAYVYTEARLVNRGFARAERPGVSPADGGVTSAELSLTGLSPWNQTGSDDTLELVAPEAGGGAQLYPDLQPETGTTSFSAVGAQLFSFSSPIFPRLDPRTDTLVLMQHVSQTMDPPTVYKSTRRAATLGAPAFDGSAPLRLSAALSELPLNHVTLDLRLSALCAPRALVHPDAAINLASFDVLPAAWGLGRYGWVGYSGELLSLYQEPGQAVDVRGTFSYGDPFPSSWGRVGSAGCMFQHRVTLPSGRAHSLYGFVGVGDELQRLVSGPVTLAISPPLDLRVDGTPASTARSLAGLTPTFGWEAPTTGTPTFYQLTVHRLTDSSSGGSVRRTNVAVISVPASVRSLQLPEGILEHGGLYVVRLGAYHAPNQDLARYETAQLPPFHNAETFSGLLSVP